MAQHTKVLKSTSNRVRHDVVQAVLDAHFIDIRPQGLSPARGDAVGSSVVHNNYH